MGWSHPEISLDDLVNLIKEFVDIIILASGYQSSGLPATWDSSNVKKALQWGLFFEDVFRRLSISDDYEGSIKELDATLLQMRSNPYFPQGLSDLSSASLTRAKDLVVKHVIHTLPLRDAHLTSLMAATVEMDFDDLRRTDYDCLNVYLEKLILQSTPTDPRSHSSVPGTKTKECASPSHTEFIIQELSKRQGAVSCVSSAELTLNILSESAAHMCKRISRNGISLLSEEQFTEYAAWMQWKSKNLSYLLDKRTVRLVSGAKLIFSASKVQWLQVFERLKGSSEAHEDYLEMIEILLLGCVSSRWTRLIEHFLSVCNCFIPISNQYQELQNLPLGRSISHSEQENGILEYLTASLSNQLRLLWKFAPILAAISIPTWSPLFRLYMFEIETQFKGDSRCCSCNHDGKKHIDCELGERIWCLYALHVLGSHLMDNTNNH